MAGRHRRRRLSNIRAAVIVMLMITAALFLMLGTVWILEDMR